ncbi:MAG: hypothetical protein QF661_12895 [Arenicellales bacterium]|nr:hypothetical protein [Arenicellales bacterium]
MRRLSWCTGAIDTLSPIPIRSESWLDLHRDLVNQAGKGLFGNDDASPSGDLLPHGNRGVENKAQYVLPEAKLRHK